MTEEERKAKEDELEKKQKELRDMAKKINETRRDLIKTQDELKNFKPSEDVLKKYGFFESGYPQNWWNPNRWSRWRGSAPESESWEGFCHAWAPAGLDPNADLIVRMNRIYANVPFGIGDLRELTSYLYPSPESLFFGARTYDKDDEPDAFDPVDLHTIITKYVGKDKGWSMGIWVIRR